MELGCLGKKGSEGRRGKGELEGAWVGRMVQKYLQYDGMMKLLWAVN